MRPEFQMTDRKLFILIKMFIYINLSKQDTQLCRLTILDESVNLDGQISKRVARTEKFQILVGKNLINKKTELFNKCPHRRKFLARNRKP